MKQEEIKNYIEKNGGITLDEKGNLFTKKEGFIVSIFGKEYQTRNIEQAVNKLIEYLKKGLICGVWFSNSVYFVDINEYYTDKEEAELVGLENKQLAIYDLGNQEEIKLIKNDFILYEYDKQLDDLVAVGYYPTLKELAEVNKISYKHAKNYKIDNFKLNLSNLKDIPLIKDKFIIVKY